ncbi:hypothetical protein FS749_002497 [Ceratobasidium sp. UAMH 11750]|nr:hypothetical protein FS749_002497 [Ceratobasidium sp. UAMH 11750]
MLPPDLDIRGGLPKWHALGHNPECIIRWGMDFMQYIGRMEGEGPERVWAHFNEHSGSTSEQGPGHRTDTLNNIAGNWNYEKMIRMSRALPTKFKDARKMRIREKERHEALTASLPPERIKEWELVSLDPVQDSKKRWTSPFADPVLKGGLHETIQEERQKESVTTRAAGRRPGATRWLSEGIELEHSIHKYNEEVKEAPNPTPRQANALNSKRMAIEDRIHEFEKKRPLYMLDLEEPDCPRVLTIIEEDGEEKTIDLMMPSSYTPETLANASLASLAELEKRLRRGTCIDASASVKRGLGVKAAAINFKNSSVRGQVATTRSETVIRGHQAKILKAQWRYLNSRDALLRLGMTDSDREQYLDLKHEDLKPLRTYYEEYARTTGHGTTSMSWIWHSSAVPNSSDWEVNALKTEWFRSRERFKRWNEQLVFLKREMVMTIRSFQKYQELWDWRSKNGPSTPGMQVYARRKSRFFGELAQRMFHASRDHLYDDIVQFQWCDDWLNAHVSDNQLV